MISVEMRGLERLRADLGKFAKQALPAAARNTLNTLAFDARREWVQQVGRKFVLRNKYTVSSLRIEKAQGFNLATMESKVGSVVPYMAEQEEGHTETARGKHGVPVPTSSAAGMAKRATRTKQVQRKNYLSAIQLAGKVSGIRQRRNAVAIRLAGKTGGVAFLDLGQKRKGLFRVKQTSKGRFTVRMIYDLSKRTVKLKPTPTLQLTLKVIGPRVPRILGAELLAQAKRFHIVGY
jgi:hypothetical protein